MADKFGTDVATTVVTQAVEAAARQAGEALKKALAAEQARVKRLKLKLLRKKMITDLDK